MLNEAQKTIRRRTLPVVVLLIHVVLWAYLCLTNSPTQNEPAHLIAGISHWKTGNFELYRVNPPLVRMAATLPIVCLGLEGNWNQVDIEEAKRPVFRMADNYVYRIGSKVVFLVRIARIACLPFVVVGYLVCWFWTEELFGERSANAACLLYGFSPMVLGHGALITTDAHAASMLLAASYASWKWHRNPKWQSNLVAAFLLGTAELCKTTSLVVLPLSAFLWLSGTFFHRPVKVYQEMGMLICRGLVVLFLINWLYGFDGFGRNLLELKFESELFTSLQHSLSSFQYVPVLLPSDYVLGIDTQLYDIDHRDWAYLLGSTANVGWWYYYLVCGSAKTTVGFLALLLASLLTLPSRKRNFESISLSFLLAPPALILLLVSMHTSYNEHFRYALPAIPFLYVFATRAVSLVDLEIPIFSWLYSTALAVSIASSLAVFPHSLSYFNELYGGSQRGSHVALSSNIDWGQDLLRLASWIEQHPEARPLTIAVYGGVSLEACGIRCDNQNRSRSDTEPWYAVSVNFLHGHYGQVLTCDEAIIEPARLEALSELDPIARIGYSIVILRSKKWEASD